MPDIFDKIWAKRAVRCSSSFVLVPFFKTFLTFDVDSNYKSVHMHFNSELRFKAIADTKTFYKAATGNIKSEAKILYKDLCETLSRDPDDVEFHNIMTMLFHYLFWISERCVCKNFPSESDVKDKLISLLHLYTDRQN